MPDDWANIVEEHVAVWQVLDPGEREQLAETTDWLLRHKHWEAAQGFALTDEITVTIATQAALLVLGLSVADYRNVGYRGESVAGRDYGESRAPVERSHS